MQRTAVNPWDWSLSFGFNQAEIIENPSRQLICSGQTSVDEKGAALHPDDMRAQIQQSLDNLVAVLKGADMGLADIINLRIYATDIGALMQNFDIIGMAFGPTGNTPPMSVLGVTGLAMPELMFEIEATASV